MCKYCYANYDAFTVQKNYAEHDPRSPFLVGKGQKEDQIHIAEQKSWIDGQMRLSDWIEITK